MSTDGRYAIIAGAIDGRNDGFYNFASYPQLRVKDTLYLKGFGVLPASTPYK
jgi:hypothetical protein